MTKPARPTSRVRRWLRWAIIGAVVIPAAAAGGFWSAVFLWPYPRTAAVDPPPAKWVTDRNGVALAAFAAPDGQWRMPLTADQISPHLLGAIVAIEDHRFNEHGGVDWRSALGAAWDDLTSLHIRRGASTITMQLHRLRVPAQRRDPLAKIEQAVRAVQIERTTDKQRILVEYLNRAPFGGNIIGAGAASWFYFGKACKDLSLAQSALLAGSPQNPNRYRPDRHPRDAELRRNIVLARLLALRAISRAAYEQALAESVDVSLRTLPQTDDDARGAMPTLLALAERSSAPITRSTLDASVQRQAFDAARRQLDSLAPAGVNAAAVVILDTASGECRAAVSLANPRTDIDLSARPRSTGSVLKPFIYAAAFERRLCAPVTVLVDSARAWEGFVPRNYDRAFRGAVTAAEALAESRNLPALQLLAKVGVRPAVMTIADAGLVSLAKSPNRYGLSLAIGGAEAKPIEVAAAYATLGRGGVTASGRPCIGADACWQILRALSDPNRTAAVCPQAARTPIAWKTGTSSENRDAWCAAVTPAVTVVVWTGNIDGRGSGALIGAKSAAPLALELACALTPRGTAFPAPPADSATPSLASSRDESKLALLTPVDGTEISPDPDAPSAAKKIPLEVLPGTTSSTLWWFVDGRSIATTTDSCTRTWWTPTAGEHEVRVVDATGRWARSRVRVRLQ